MRKSLDELSVRIAVKYKEFEDKYAWKYGWSFLYTSADTFACSNGLIFLGLNPGGDGNKCSPANICKANNEGNAYRSECWGKPKGNHPLQIQVQRFFESLTESSLWKDRTCEQLLDETLTSNFCPFRSPSWEDLKPGREEAISFSTEFWAGILPQIAPRVIICMGAETYSCLTKVLEKTSAKYAEEKRLPTGWGNVKFAIQQYKSSGWNPVLARIPHLSRFKVMRPQREPLVKEFVATLSDMVA